MFRVGGADNGGGHVGIADGKAQHEFHGCHTIEQIIDGGLLPEPATGPEGGLQEGRIFIDDGLIPDHEQFGN